MLAVLLAEVEFIDARRMRSFADCLIFASQQYMKARGIPDSTRVYIVYHTRNHHFKQIHLFIKFTEIVIY